MQDNLSGLGSVLPSGEYCKLYPNDLIIAVTNAYHAASPAFDHRHDEMEKLKSYRDSDVECLDDSLCGSSIDSQSYGPLDESIYDLNELSVRSCLRDGGERTDLKVPPSATPVDRPGLKLQCGHRRTNGPGWTILVPEIDKAIQRLRKKSITRPCDQQVADELQITLISYTAVLGFLERLGGAAKYGLRAHKRTRHDLVALPNEPGVTAQLRCLSDALDSLLINVLDTPSNLGRMLLTFTYDEVNRTKAIHLRLASVEENGCSAFRPVDVSIKTSLTSEVEEYLHKVLHRRRPDRVLSDLEVRVTQSGWIPRGFAWESAGDEASWQTDSRVWYSLDAAENSCELMRKDTYNLTIGNELH